MENAINKSISESEKADYYDDKISSINNNSAISSDDPQAIQKLEKKLEHLEEQKLEIKTREHAWYELPYINKEIKRVKERIESLKELDKIEFKEIVFNGGKITHNKKINRIQILFDDIPNEEIRTLLKRRGFKWSRNEGAWQRLFNKSSIHASKCVLEELNKK